MNSKLLNEIEKEHNVSTEEVEKEINNALKAINCDMEPDMFIACIAKQAKKTIHRNSYNSQSILTL